MSNNKKQLLVLSVLALLTTTGCLNTENKNEPAQQQPQIDHRAVLVEALNKQAVSVVTGINEVVIKGAFLKSMSLENPPEPIPLNDNNEVSKAINYLLSNQTAQNGTLIYTPDAKICSEVIAKNNPQSCETLMKEVSLVQFPADATTGVVDIYVAQSKLMRLTYSAETLLAQFEASGVVGALREASIAGAKMGEQSFEATLPVVHTGELSVLVSSMFGLSTISIGVMSDIKLAGQNEQQKPYALEIGKRESAISLTLSAAALTGIVQLDIPAVKLTSPIFDHNDDVYEIQIDFPGAAGMLTLDNALSRISLADFKMAQDFAYAKIDGQLAVQLFSNKKLDGYLQGLAGNKATVKSIGQFSAQADVYANNMFADNGQINLSIAAATEVLFDHNKDQGKFISGSLNLTGTGSFNGQINITAGECVGDDQNSNDIITKVVCK